MLDRPKKSPASEAVRQPGAVERLLVEHVSGTRHADLPAAAVAATKALVLDTLGSAVAGTCAEGCDAVAGLAEGWAGKAEARIIGRGTKVPAQNAVLANATMARALEIDDVHEAGMLHPTASMAPIALAVGEKVGGVDGRSFLTAVVLGNEMAIRLGTAPRADVGAGRAGRRTQSHTFHVGSMAGALVAGKLMGLKPDALHDAFGIGYSQCAGNLQGVEEGALVVRVQQGLSAAAGVVAAELAAAGISGARASLTGASGYYAALHGGRFDPEALLGGLGETFLAEEVSIKPYPCCKHIHTAAAAAEELMREHAIDPQAVERVVVKVRNREYYDVVCLPEDKAERRAGILSERGWVHAQMSMPFVIAAAICDGVVRLDRFDRPGRTAPDVIAMLDRIDTEIDASGGETALPTPGLVEIYLRGRDAPLSAEVRYVKGHPRNPMSFDEVAAKFMNMTEFAASRFSGEQRERIVDAVANIEALPDIRALADLLVADRN